MTFMEIDANESEIEVNLFILRTGFGQQFIFVWTWQDNSNKFLALHSLYQVQ